MSYDIDKIVDKLLADRLSWVNTNDSNEKPLGDTFPTTARRFYNQLGDQQLSLRSVESILESPEYYGYDAYQQTKTYSIGNKVSNGNELSPFYYESITDNNTGNPVTDIVNWKQKYFFAELLKQKTIRVVESTIVRVLNKKKEFNQTKPTLLQATLVDTDRSGQSTTVKQGNVRGISLCALEYNNIAFVIKTLGVKLTEEQTLPIYVYHTSQETGPIATFNIEAGPNFQLNDIDQLKLGYITDNYNTGGEFKICYYESDLVGSAIEQKLDYNYYSSCNCGGRNSSKAKKAYQFIKRLEPFYVDSTDLPNDLSLWPDDAEQFDKKVNFGFNFQFQIECDLTSIILNNLNLWDDVFIKGMKVSLYETAQESLRHNDTKMMHNQFATALLNEDGGNLRGEYEKSISDMNLDLSDLDSPCMPQLRQKGVRRGTI